MQSKSVNYTETGEIELIEIEVQDPGSGEIQLRGAVCGICSWDIATCKLGMEMSVPAPPGHEGIGYVTKVGAGVTGFKEGDRVAGGGFHTLRNQSTTGLHRLPESSSLDDVFWLVEPLSCVVTGIDVCRLRAGDRVAVIGCGFMGQMLLQVLTRSYALEVIGLDINADRLEMARSFGVNEVYNLSDSNTDDLIQELHSRNIDIVIDTSGSQSGLDLATKLVRRGGMINLFGWIKGTQATFDPSTWHLGGFTIVNSSPNARMRNPFPVAIDLIEHDVVDLKPLVTHIVDLEAYPDLMKQIIAGDGSYVKGVIRLND